MMFPEPSLVSTDPGLVLMPQFKSNLPSATRRKLSANSPCATGNPPGVSLIQAMSPVHKLGVGLPDKFVVNVSRSS